MRSPLTKTVIVDALGIGLSKNNHAKSPSAEGTTFAGMIAPVVSVAYKLCESKDALMTGLEKITCGLKVLPMSRDSGAGKYPDISSGIKSLS